ncbi:MAG: sialate O-acetylesterase [Lachnospiraceae bacterium]|nr:sialate O-acetylesterase [Lachnospiraceae bacterium]
MSNLRLPRLISDGMVLQRDRKNHIWGYDVPGRNITVSFIDDVYKTVTDPNGRFEVWLEPVPFGGPYTVTVCDDADESFTVSDVLVGEVWLCSGQSNMELPMDRVKDRYPEEFDECDYPNVREFKITEDVDFTAPLDEVRTGCWRRPDRSYLGSFSATAYFFAKELNILTGIPVGFIDASLGGSKIECWMSREMLKGYDDKLAIADEYAPKAVRDAVNEANIKGMDDWHAMVDAMDEGLKEHWESDDTDDREWKEITLPAFFKDTEIGDMFGCIWFRKSFNVPAKMAGKSAKLWLGTIVDSDKTYVNGVYVGQTDYQYPPRKYDIPEGLLREGRNTVTVRMNCEYLEGFPGAVHSAARFTPGKEYKLFDEEYSIDLTGEWKYRVGAVTDVEFYRQNFVSWKPVGLYNAMTAPCHKYTIGGFNWYQGESDCEETGLYKDLFLRMIDGYRKEWDDETLFASIVQLPNFTIDNDPCSEAWQRMRETLRALGEQIKDCESVTAIDLGEDNDLHPVGKKELGRRLALVAAHFRCGTDIEYSGPRIEKSVCVKSADGAVITLSMSHVSDGIVIKAANGKGDDLKVTDMYIVDDAGNHLRAAVSAAKDKLILNVPGLNRSAREIRYCYAQSNSGALIYNSEGLPMSPGIYKL